VSCKLKAVHGYIKKSVDGQILFDEANFLDDPGENPNTGTIPK
jgi:hypothetical protein